MSGRSVAEWLPLTISPPPSDSQLDSTPGQLTPQEPQLCLVDAGYFINTSSPSMFRPGRRLDLILSFDYSPSSPFEVLLVAQLYSAPGASSKAPGPLAQTACVPKGGRGARL